MGIPLFEDELPLVVLQSCLCEVDHLSLEGFRSRQHILPQLMVLHKTHACCSLVE